MKKTLLLLFIFINIVAESFSQVKNTPDSVLSVSKFKSYLEHSVKYPALSRSAKVAGKVIFAFWVDENKTISDIRILKDLPDSSRCADVIIHKVKDYKELLNIKPGEYVCSADFIMIEDDDEVKNSRKIKDLAGNFKNYLFEAKVMGYGSILKEDYIIDVAYLIPQFEDHVGKIRSLNANRFKVSKDGTIRRDSIAWKLSEKFSLSGQIIEKATILTDIDSSSRKYVNRYLYDERDSLTEEQSYDDKGKFYSKNIYLYDNSGRKIEQDNYYSPTDSIEKKIVYGYDNKRLIISELTYNREGQIVDKVNNKYLDGIKQLEIEENTLNRRNITFKYFVNGLLSEEYPYDGKGGSGLIKRYKYDKKKSPDRNGAI